MTVANLQAQVTISFTSASCNLGTNQRPLVIMSPKSLLRNKTVSDPISKFTSGKFEPILTEEHDKEAVKKVVLASGKMFIDLKEHLAKNPNNSILLIAVERLYPFPASEMKHFK